VSDERRLPPSYIERWVWWTPFLKIAVGSDSRTPAFNGSWLQWPQGAPSPSSLTPHKTHELVLPTVLTPLGNWDGRDGHLQCQGERWRRAECRPAPASSHPINGKRKHVTVDRHSRSKVQISKRTFSNCRATGEGAATQPAQK
jgi:hypothetical protein